MKTYPSLPTLKVKTMRLLIIILLLAISTTSFAASSVNPVITPQQPVIVSTPGSTFSLTPTPGDASVQYLSQIFGQVGNVLTGTNDTLIAQVFYGFNYAVIFLACILIVYTLFVSILNTAQDGEMMGKKWSSIWVPLRMVAGLALLLPVSAGYSAMQVIVMWVVLQGVGAADSIWGIAVKGLTNNQGTFNPPTLTSEEGMKTSRNAFAASESLLNFQVCMNVLNQVYSENTGSGSSCQVVPISNTTNEYQISCSETIFIPEEEGGGSNVLMNCGTITPDYSSISTNYPNLEPGGGPSNFQIYTGVQTGLSQMLAAITPAAQAITNDVAAVSYNNSPITIIPENAISTGATDYTAPVTQAITNYIIAVGKENPQKLFNAMKSITQQLISDYNLPINTESDLGAKYPPCNATQEQEVINDVKSDMKEFPNLYRGNDISYSEFQTHMNTIVNRYGCDPLPNDHPKNTTSKMESTGWFDAGQYYLVLAERSFVKANASNIAMGGRYNTYGHGSIELQYTGEPAIAGVNLVPYQDAVNKYASIERSSIRNSLPKTAPVWMGESSLNAPNSGDPSDAMVNSINQAMGQWSALYAQLSGYVYMHQSYISESGGSSSCGLGIFCSHSWTAYHFGNGRKRFQDPFIAIQNFGTYLIYDAVQGFKNTGLWFSSTEAEEWWKYALPGGSIWGNQAIDDMIAAAWYLPVGVAILGAMLSAGIMMGVYMPLIPFILFTLGAIGWLLGVVEAMVAAPIVCFGLMHPNGQNEVVSKAEPAVMLLINTFIRPGLMVVGLLVSLGLVYVCISVINDGFATVLSSLVTFGARTSGAFVAAAFMGIYGLLLVLVVQKCFSLVSLIPDSVLRWIQGGEAAREQFGAFDQIGEQMGQKVGSAASSAGQAAGQSSTQQASGEEQIAGNAQKKEDGLF